VSGDQPSLASTSLWKVMLSVAANSQTTSRVSGGVTSPRSTTAPSSSKSPDCASQRRVGTTLITWCLKICNCIWNVWVCLLWLAKRKVSSYADIWIVPGLGGHRAKGHRRRTFGKTRGPKFAAKSTPTVVWASGARGPKTIRAVSSAGAVCPAQFNGSDIRSFAAWPVHVQVFACTWLPRIKSAPPQRRGKFWPLLVRALWPRGRFRRFSCFHKSSYNSWPRLGAAIN
jgi:hypothetical protein